MTPMINSVDEEHLDQVNILIVDDLPEKHIVYKTILEELGQNLIFVSSGAEALKQILQQEFAVILLDVNMPGMDGFETASLIRARKKSAKTPIIFLTAFMDEIHAAKGYASGAVDYLPTPVMPEVLKAKVRVFIELFQMRQYAAYQMEDRVKRRAAEEIARCAEFLVKASEALALAQNRKEVMDSLLCLPIPEFADLTIAWLLGDNGKAEQINWLWKDTKEETGSPLSMNLSVTSMPWLQKIMDEKSISAQVQVFKNLSQPSPLTSGTALPDVSSVIILPLMIRKTILGILVLARQGGSADYQESDVSWGRTLASRAAIALENVMLIEKIREADRRKDEFLAMLAHELRNPLAPIRNALEIWKRGEAGEKAEKECQAIMDRQLQKMVRLLDDLLDIARITRGVIELKKGPVDLVQLINQSVEAIRHHCDKRQNKLSLSLPKEEVVLVKGDAIRLEQVVSNLLNNACKYTEPGGHIAVTLEYEMGNALIRIADDGIGISPELLPYIFDLFVQAERSLDRKQGGLGLGLTLVRRLVELQGGTVEAKSQGLKKGSEFIIRLPIMSEAEVALPVVPPAAKKAQLAKRRILVIEDNVDAAKTTQMLLELQGHKVQVAFGGQSGIKAAQIFKPEVIILDIGLPGMDGYEVARRLRELPETKNVLLIALSGYGQAEDRLKSKEAGFNHHLVKPADADQLKALISA